MCMNRTVPGDRRDAGFTLVELLLAIVILGVIALTVGNVVLGVIKNTDSTSDRLALSHDAQISTAYFARDVAGAGVRDYSATADGSGNLPYLPSVQLDAAYNAGGSTCGTAATPVATIRLLSDDWDNSGAAPVARRDVVAYYLQPAGAVSELHRMKCVGSTTPVSDLVVAHYVDPATVSATCSSTCAGTPAPQQVTLSFSVTRPSVGAYHITLNGQRRQT